MLTLKSLFIILVSVHSLCLCITQQGKPFPPPAQGPVGKEQYSTRLPRINGDPLSPDVSYEDFQRILKGRGKEEATPRVASRAVFPNLSRDSFDEARESYIKICTFFVDTFQHCSDRFSEIRLIITSWVLAQEWKLYAAYAASVTTAVLFLIYVVLMCFDAVKKVYSRSVKYCEDKWMELRCWYYSKTGVSTPAQEILEGPVTFYTKKYEIHVYQDQTGKEVWLKSTSSGFEPYQQPMVLEKEMAVPGSLLLKSNKAEKLVVVLGDGSSQTGCGAIIRHKGGFWLSTVAHVRTISSHVQLSDGRWVSLSRYVDTSRREFFNEDSDFAMVPITPVMGTDLGVKALDLAKWTTFASRPITVLTRTQQGQWAQSSGKTLTGVHRTVDGAPMFLHSATTHPGFSGSPVVLEVQNSYLYVGAHIGASAATGYNYYYPLSLITKTSLTKPTGLVIETDIPADGYGFEEGDADDLGEEIENLYLPDNIVMKFSESERKVAIIRDYNDVAARHTGLSHGGNVRWIDEIDEERADDVREHCPNLSFPVQYNKRPETTQQGKAPTKPAPSRIPKGKAAASTKVEVPLVQSNEPGPSTRVKPSPSVSLNTLASVSGGGVEDLGVKYSRPAPSVSGNGQAPQVAGPSDFVILKAFNMQPHQIYLVKNEPIFFCKVGTKLVVERTERWLTKEQWAQRVGVLCNSGQSEKRSSGNQGDKSSKTTTQA